MYVLSYSTHIYSLTYIYYTIRVYIGAAAKAFITYTETNDIFLIIGALSAFGLNLILFIQVLYLQLQIPCTPTATDSTTTTGNIQPAAGRVATDEKKPGTHVGEVGEKGEGKKYDLRKRK